MTLRELKGEDAAFLYRLRNDPATRASSLIFEQGIGWKDNYRSVYAWVEKRDRKAYIALSGGKPVGVVRWQLSGLWHELAWIVAPECRRRGYGTQMVRAIMNTLPHRCFARIRTGNLASEKVAAANGLRPAEEIDGVRYWRAKNSQLRAA